VNSLGWSSVRTAPHHLSFNTAVCQHLTRAVPHPQVHASACVPPKWRSGPRASEKSHGYGVGQHHRLPKTVSVPEVHYYQYSADTSDLQRSWATSLNGHPLESIRDVATPDGKLSNGLQLRTLSSGSLESVDIPLTG